MMKRHILFLSTFFSLLVISFGVTTFLFAASLQEIRFTGTLPVCNDSNLNSVSLSGGVLKVCKGAAAGWKSIATDDATSTIFGMNGNVGIGTASPATKLSIGFDDASSNTTQYLRFQNDASGYVQWAFAKTGSNDLSVMNLGTGGGSTPVMTYQYVAGAGNVGIGTTSPGTKLEVSGQGRFNSGASFSAIDTGWASSFGYSSGNWGVRLGATGGQGVIQAAQNTTAYNLAIQPYGGNVSIGTTTASYKLDVNGAGTFNNNLVHGVAVPLVAADAANKGYVDSLVGSGLTGVGTVGYSAYWTGAASLATSSIYYSSSTGNVGIGTTAPGNKLEVNGQASIGDPTVAEQLIISNALTYSGLKIKRVGVDKWAIFNNNAGTDYLDIYAYGASAGSKLVITPTGNVGIGTTAPLVNLHIAKGYGTVPATAGETLLVQNNLNTTDVASISILGGATGSSKINFGDVNDMDIGRITYDHSANKFFFSYGSAEKMTIDIINERVGIKTTTPSQALDVQGNIAVGTNIIGGGLGYGATSSASYGTITPYNGSANMVFISAYVNAGAPSNGGINFATGGTAVKVRIDQLGSVGIATTTPQAALHVVGNVIGDTPTAVNHLTTKAYVDSMFTGSGQWTTSGSYVYLTSTTQRVGIGTTNPSTALEIGDTSSIGNYVKVVGSNSENTYDVFRGERKYPRFTLKDTIAGGSEFNFWNLGAQMRFGTHTGSVDSAGFVVNSGARPVVFMSGNVALGPYGNDSLTTSRNVSIYVNRPYSSYPVSAGSLTLQATGATPASTNNNGGVLALLSGISTGSGSSYITFNTATEGTTGTTDNTQTEKMRILGNGNVGIGTTVPGEAAPNGWNVNANSRILEIKTISTAGDAGLQITRSDGGAGLHLWEDSSTGKIYLDNLRNDPLADILFRTRTSGTPVDALTILGSGNVGIATTTPQAALHVVGNVIGNTPTAANHLTTKAYVDTAITFVSSTLSSSTLWTASGNNIYNLNSANVGIGTTNPGAKIDISPSLATSGISKIGQFTLPYQTANEIPLLAVVSSGGTSISGIAFPLSNGGSYGDIAFYNLGATHRETMRIAGSGNVGIGTTAPARLLHVNSAANNYIRLQATGADTYAGYELTNDAQGWTTGVNSNDDYVISDGLQFSGDNIVTVQNGAPVNTFYIKDNGLVGIGTTNPGSNLEVYGTNASLQSIVVKNSGTYAVLMGVNSTQGYFGSNNATAVNLITNNVSRVYISTAGNVGVGTTTPASVFTVVGTASFSQPVVVGTPSADNHAATKSYVDSASLWMVGAGGITLTNNAEDVSFGDGNGVDLTVGSGAGKIDVGTVDPVYTINGKRYATYMTGMTGVKEETVGILKTKCQNSNVKNCESIIDFKNAEIGSDIWLFAKTTNLKKDFNMLSVLLTPAFGGQVWYKKDSANLRLMIYSTEGGEVSYRLTAPRFDTAKWTNYTDTKHEGFNLDKLIKE